MTEQEAESILLLLCAAFPSYEITPPTVGLWIHKLKQREFEIAKLAANRWIDERYKFPTIAEFWDNYQAVWRERWEAQKRALRLVPAEPASQGMTADRVHIWRASLGQPKEDCTCEFCALAREVKERQA